MSGEGRRCRIDFIRCRKLDGRRFPRTTSPTARKRQERHSHEHEHPHEPSGPAGVVRSSGRVGNHAPVSTGTPGSSRGQGRRAKRRGGRSRPHRHGGRLRPRRRRARVRGGSGARGPGRDGDVGLGVAAGWRTDGGDEGRDEASGRSLGPCRPTRGPERSVPWKPEGPGHGHHPAVPASCAGSGRTHRGERRSAPSVEGGREDRARGPVQRD